MELVVMLEGFGECTETTEGSEILRGRALQRPGPLLSPSTHGAQPGPCCPPQRHPSAIRRAALDRTKAQALSPGSLTLSKKGRILMAMWRSMDWMSLSSK